MMPPEPSTRNDDPTRVLADTIDAEALRIHSLVAGAQAITAQLAGGDANADATHAEHLLALAMQHVDDLQELALELARRARDHGEPAMVRAA